MTEKITSSYVRARPIDPKVLFRRRLAEQIVQLHKKWKNKGKKKGSEGTAFKGVSFEIDFLIRRVLKAYHWDYPNMGPAGAKKLFVPNMTYAINDLTRLLAMREEKILIAPVCAAHFKRPDPDTPSNADLAERGLLVCDPNRSRCRSRHKAWGIYMPLEPRQLFYKDMVWWLYITGKAAHWDASERMLRNGWNPLDLDSKPDAEPDAKPDAEPDAKPPAAARLPLTRPTRHADLFDVPPPRYDAKSDTDS